MTIANLYNIPTPGASQEVWSFAHQDQHLKIANAIFQKYGIDLPLYVLDPMPAFNSPEIGTWGYSHQQAHTAFDEILGISGNDLTAVDFTKQDQVESWLQIHAVEHIDAQRALGFPD